MTFELYNDWVKVARWVCMLGQKSLVGPNDPPPSLPVLRAGLLRLVCHVWRYKHSTCSAACRWPKTLEKAIKTWQVRGKAAVLLIARTD